jgi:hypothetical protein
MSDRETEPPVRPEHKAELSHLALNHWVAKDPAEWGLSERVLRDMEAAGLAERVGSRWIATPAGQRALHPRKTRARR